VRAFRRHVSAFVLVNGVLTAVNVYMGAPWWAFWPLAIWGFALTIHFLVYRTLTVDDSWVEERTLDLRSKSYDMSHMDSIRERTALGVKEKAGPVRPPDGGTGGPAD